LEEQAYLQARGSNAGAYAFLSSSQASIFVGGSFVCRTSLKHCSPGETFTVFMGVDRYVANDARKTFLSCKQHCS
jgi:hypothetical protein